MSKLKQRKYVALLGILILVIGIIGLITYGRVDKYKGLIKIKEAKVLSSVGNTSFVMSKGTEEVEYEMEYTLDEIEGVEKRDVIIEGKINNEYATFKEIEGRNITSTLKENGKEIEIEIKDVRLGEEQRITIKVQVTNAPNKEEIIPEIKIKETTGEYTRVNTEAIKVETNSVEGIVYDENKVPVTDIELSINKNGREIKRTYTKEDGRFIFSDLEEGEYEIKVEEEVYELEGNGKTREENERLELRVKEVDKFNIETHKYIEKLRLVVNGKEENYTYKDAEKVIENVKNAKSISGEIEYRITVENKGEKETVVERVIDEPGEGLEFKATKNTGWEEEEGKIKYKPIEGSSLKGKEKREIKLVLSITKTNEIKEYINKLNTKGEIKEKVVYVIDGKIVREESVIEGERIEKPNFGIENLDGWYTDTNYTNKYKFSKEVNKDIILYAKTKAEKNKYQVRYIDEGNIVKEEEIEEGNKTVAPEEPSKRGYTFKCWTLENNCYDFEEEVNKDIDLISSYEPIKYTITYDLDEGSLEEGKTNPKEYTIETESFTLNNPSKRGYTFIGWTGSNGNEPSDVTIEKGSTGNKEYTANYEINDYKLEIDPKGGEYSGELLVNGNYGTIVTITEPRKTGYTFTGWTLTGSGIYNNNLYTFEEGNGKLEANYTPIEYTITYKGITEEEKRSLNNPETYTIETNLFTLNNPSNRLNEDNEGEVFVGWKEKESDTPSMSISLPDVNNLGNKEYTAIFNEREADKWNITYELKGGEVSGNPSTYKRSELPITLNNPEKEGYTFIGWTGSNGREPSNVTIPKNTTGDLNYEANYTPKEYTITYDLDGGSVSTPNKETYTIETETFSLNNPSKEGYTFEGWIGSNGTTPQTNVSIAKGSTGNKNYEAKYTINKYNVEFYNMNSNGEYTLNKTVEDIDYNTVIPSNEVPEVSLRGYTFKYWSLDKINEYDLETKVTKNIKLYAVYTKDIYTITYDLDGGSLEEGKTNPSTYQVDTERFTLNNPRKAGHEFKGWTGSNGNVPEIEVTLPDNKLENKNYKANYEINKYTVTYMNGNEKFYEEEVEYNKTAKGTTTNPSKAHNIFLKWVKEDGTEYDFNTPVINNMTLYASYEEVEAPEIKHTPTEWTRNNVEVTITSDHTDYEYMYKVGNGEYKKYTGAFEVEENSTIYAYSIKSEVTSVEVIHDITNIDKINPSINSLTNTDLSPVSASLNIKGQDNESGLKYIKIYLDNELVFTSEEYTSNLNEEKELEYTISNLEQLTTYTVKVEVTDKVGNISNEEIEITTPAKHYVARTLDKEGNEITKYETLKEAIESTECVSICTIQMLDNVEETNSVLEGQDITLDLNGKVITGLQEKAFENNGNLQIVDHNEEEVGKITSEGIGIINNGKLIVGENEEELVVSKEEPIIEGSITGVNSPGELHFYDGKIIGGSTTGALKGSAPITPYSYNASVETTGGKEIATLEIIADAEARINSVYYTKAQAAIDDSKIGKYVTPEGTAEIMSQVESKTDYGFTYDENTNTLKSNNQGISNSTANSYICFDITNELEDQVISIDASISSQSGADIGYVTIKETREIPLYSDSEDRLIYISGTNNDNINYLLEKGKKYYVHFGYRKDGGTNSGDDTFIINSIKLSDYDKDAVNGELIDHIISNDIYHFKKDGENGYVNTNIGSRSTLAHSYIKIDMTDETETKLLYVDASISAPQWYSNIDYGYITITDSADIPSYDQEEGRVLLKNGNNARNLYEINLIPGQVNYIHFGYNKVDTYNNGSYSDTFRIYSVKLQSSIVKEHLNSDITPNGTYYMYETNIEPCIWKDLSGNENDGVLHGAYHNGDNNSIYLTGDSSNIEITSSNINTNNNETVVIEFIPTNNSDTLLYKGNSNEIISQIDVYWYYSSHIRIATKDKSIIYSTPSDFLDGTKKRFVVVHNNDEFKLYYNGIELSIESQSEGIDNSGTENTIIGNTALSLFNVMVYSRTVAEEEIIADNIANNNLLLHLDSSNYQKESENPIFINNNQSVPNSVASSYMVFDLTDVSSYKTIYVNAEISSQSSDWWNGGDRGYVTVTDSETVPSFDNGNGRYVYIMGEVEAQEYPITLTPGRVNYVHFAYRKDGSTNSGTDTFKINYIKEYQDSEKTIPEYIFSNSTTKKNYSPVVKLNEEPDTVQIIRNITLTNPLEIVETRDVVLDLNGYTLTTSKEDYVIKNSGSLKVIDTNYTQTGNITSTTSSTILNNYDSYLNIDTAIITINKPGAYDAITNRGSITLDDNGTINGLQANNRGINNAITGVILDGTGTINTFGSNSISILNDSRVDDSISGYNLNSSYNNSYNFYNNGKKDLTLDSIKTSGAGIDIYQNTNNNLLIKDSTLGSTGNESFYSNQSSVESTITFNNCEIYNRVQNRSGSYRKIIINESNLYDSNLGQNVYNYDGVVEINDSELTHKSWNLENYGTMEINNSLLNADHHSISNSSNRSTRGSMILNNVVINTKGLSSENVINNYSDLVINDGEINNNSNNSTSIYNSVNGKILISGEFKTSENFSRGISNDNGILVLGNNDETVSDEYPLIQATNEAIYNNHNSTFNYYDGKLIGKLDNALDGPVNEIPQDYDLFVKSDETNENITLKSYSQMETDGDYIAEVDDVKYTNLQDAFDNSDENSEVKILKSFYTNNNVIVSNNSKLNMNGKSIKYYGNNNELLLVNNNLIILDSSENVGSVRTFKQPIINNNSIVNIEDVTLYSKMSNSLEILQNNENATMTINGGDIYTYFGRVINNLGKLNILDGTIRYINTTVGGAFSIIDNASTGTVNISGGEFPYYAGTKAIITNENVINVTGGTFRGRRNAGCGQFSCSGSISNTIVNEVEATATITGGTYESSDNLSRIINNKGQATISGVTSKYLNVAINSGTLSIDNFTDNNIGSGASIQNTGILTVDDSNLSGGHDAVYTSGNGHTELTNVTINSSMNEYYVNAVIFTTGSNAETIIHSGTITSRGNTATIGVSSSAKTTIEQGIITGQATTISTSGITKIIEGTIVSNTGNAIYANGGTLDIGVTGGEPSKTNPSITGKNYGLYNNNSNTTVNFYDGIISGTNAIEGSIENIEPGYSIITTNEDDIESKYLDLVYTFENITKTSEYGESDDYKYYTLQDAIDNSDDGDELKLLREVIIMPDGETVSNSKNLAIDFNGYKMVQNNEKFLVNNGSLLLIDRTIDKRGSIQSNSGSIIDNNGTLVIEQVNVYSSVSSVNTILQNNENATMTINGGDIYTYFGRVINNLGELNILDGTIRYINTTVGGAFSIIDNASTGTVNISGGEFPYYAGTKAIITNENVINVTGGTFRGRRNAGCGQFSCSGSISNTIVNEVEATATITGGTYESSDNLSRIINNKGQATISGVTSKYLNVAINSGTLSIDNFTDNNIGSGASIQNTGILTVDDSNLSGGHDAVYTSGNGHTELTNVTINSSMNEYYVNGVIFTTGSNAETIIHSGTITSRGNTATIGVSSSAKTTIEQGIITGQATTISTSGITKIIEGTIVSNTGNAIYANGGTLDIGVIGGEPSKTNPSITGKKYGLYNNNSNATVNFYDGIISGTNAIEGSIENIEPNYSIITETVDGVQSKYLDRTYAFENITKTSEYGESDDYKYYTLQDAIDDANNGDSIKTIREVVGLPTDLTINNNKTITLDLNGFTIVQNNNILLSNEGSLTIIDNSESKTGLFKSNSGSIIDNKGILIINNGSYYSDNTELSDILINEENATMTINNGDIHTHFSRVINNSGVLNINGGKLYNSYAIETISVTSGHVLIENGNTATVNVTGGEFIYSGTGGIIGNNGQANLSGGTYNSKGGRAYIQGSWSYYLSNVIINYSTGNTLITGGTYASDTNNSRIINNQGVANITGISTVYASIATNSGDLTITSVVDNNLFSPAYCYCEGIINSGTLKVFDSTISGNRIVLVNNANAEITNSIFTTSSTTITNNTGNGVLTINSGDFESTGGENVIAVGENSVAILKNGTFTSNTGSTIVVSGTMNIENGNIISKTNNGIYTNSGSTLNIGVQGGIPSVTNPIISGKTYGLYNNSNTSNFYFYDGIIKGETGSIYGTITDTEAGYKEKRDNVTDPDTGVTTIESTLTVIGSTERVAVVNNINFLSLQAAVNYASNNNIENIQLYKSVILEDNIVKPESGSNVKIYLGGNTITEGSYTIGEGIELVEGTAPSASISRFLASITGTEINPRNIIIFEMSDGSKLEANVTYKLYKLTDNGYKIVKLKENELGDYDIGSIVEKMNTARGKLYINQIGEGNYKLVGTDDKEVNFEITSEGISNNIRINNGVRKNRIVETIATLILSLQTGVVRNPYVLMIMILIVIILSFIAYKKYKEGYGN